MLIVPLFWDRKLKIKFKIVPTNVKITFRTNKKTALTITTVVNDAVVVLFILEPCRWIAYYFLVFFSNVWTISRLQLHLSVYANQLIKTYKGNKIYF